MKQTKLIFDTSSHEIHQDYLRIMSQYKREVEMYKNALKTSQDEPGCIISCDLIES